MARAGGRPHRDRAPIAKIRDQPEVCGKGASKRSHSYREPRRLAVMRFRHVPAFLQERGRDPASPLQWNIVRTVADWNKVVESLRLTPPRCISLRVLTPIKNRRTSRDAARSRPVVRPRRAAWEQGGISLIRPLTS